MDALTRSALGVIGGVAVAPTVGGPVGAWGLLAVGASLLALRMRHWGLAAAVALGIASVRALPDGPRWSGPVSVVGVRVGAALGRSGDVRVARWARPGGPWTLDEGRIRVRFPERPPPIGTPVALFGHAGTVPRSLDGAPDPVRAASLSRIHTQVRAERVAVLVPLERRAPPHDPTGLLAAVAVGDRGGVPRDTMQLLRRTGTAHLLAISGFHVGVLAALAAGLALVGLRAIAAARPSGWPTELAGALGVAAAALYAYAAGAPLSAQRAAGWLGLVALGRALGRSPNPVPLLGVVATGIVVVDPSAVATPGFQLSFGAVLGLLLFGTRWSSALPPLPWWLDWLAKGVIATAASTLGTLPAAAWWFQEVAPLSAPANLLAMPIMGFGIVPLAAAATWSPAPVDDWAATLGSWLCNVLLTVLEPLAVAPMTPAVGPLGALLLAGALLVGLVRWWGGALLTAAVLGWPTPREAGFTVLDVGQGDAILVEHDDGTVWLVDGGPQPGAVLAWLRRQGIRHLDVVVATHGDWDHYAGLLPILTDLSVGALWAIDPPDRLVDAATAGGVPIRTPEQALWPPSDGSAPAGRRARNDRSIVLAVGPALLVGDLGSSAEAALAPTLPGPFPILKVGHHGSATSTSEAWLQRIHPTLAVISVGVGNRYGHPSEAVVDRLHRAGAAVLRTDVHGTITVRRTDGDTWCATGSRRPEPPVCFATATPRRPTPQ